MGCFLLVKNNKKRSSTGLLAQMNKAKWCYIGILPTLLLLATFKMYPAIDGIAKSFYNWKKMNYYMPKFIGLANYKRLFHDGEFWLSFGNLGIYIAANLVTTFCICLVITYLVHKLDNSKLAHFFQRAFVIPMMIPGMVVTLFWKFFYEYNDGLLNSILRGIGLGKYATVWLGNNLTAMPSIIFTGFPWIGGFAFLVFLSGFQSIDQSLGESANLDGANAFVKFFRIDLPLIVPQIKILLMLTLIDSIKQYDLFMVMTNGQYKTMVPGLYMYQSAFSYGNYGYAASMGVVLFIIILALTIFQNKYIQKND